MTELMSKKKQAEILLTKVSDILKDTDDEEYKEKIRRFLSDVSDAYIIMMVGDRRSGRTSLVNHLFLDGSMKAAPTVGVEELRYGAREAFVEVGSHYHRRFFTSAGLEGIAVLDTEDISLYEADQVQHADALIIVFTPEDIQSTRVWDFIEKNSHKRMVFLLNQADRLTCGELNTKKEKIKQYAAEAGVFAPVFGVSAKDQEEGLIEGGVEDVKSYIRDRFFENDPGLLKLNQNMQEIRVLLSEFKEAFAARIRQYETDSRLLEEIDQKMGVLRECQDDKINTLKKEAAAEIEKEIYEFRDLILKTLDPKTLRTNPYTRDRKAFSSWLENEILDPCQQRLVSNIEEMSRRVLNRYLDDLEDIYTGTLELLRNRPTESLDNRFYGSLISGKKKIAGRCHEITSETRSQCLSLKEAAFELYENVDKENLKYEKRKGGFNRVSGFTSFALPTVLIFSLAGGVPGAVLAVISGLIVKNLLQQSAEEFIDQICTETLDKKVRISQERFVSRIDQIKDELTNQVQERITSVFGQEVDRMDKSFRDFRMTTNIDSKNIPLLEAKLKDIQDLFTQFQLGSERYCIEK